MHYTIINKTSRRFEILNDHQQLLGHLEYASWFFTKAQILTTDNNSYNIAPANFWGMRMTITKNGMPYAELKYGFMGQVTLTLNGKPFLFKRKSIWRASEYALLSGEQEIAKVLTTFKLKKMSYNYEVDVQDGVFSKEDSVLLPFLLLFCVKSLQRRHAAAV